ncbi:hypothetical protein [Methylomonas albis]|uniref:Uncharacterized protein n=1 Tax=Methylomonas albis TaxID=1854563 RepID=A0ABR9D483_9GAMM|nr:hypothetical protein [Methylomonas albis]MBD9357024.1 hypothetical protein [Methylomonas albis]
MYRPYFKAHPLALAFAGILANGLLTSPALAYELVWDGSGDSDNWFYSNNDFLHPNTNWLNNDPLLLPTAGDTLVFKGSTRLTPLNDGPDAMAINGITFAADAKAFTLNGNPIVSIGNIVNASRNLQTINMRIAIGADQIWDGGNIPGGFLQVNQFTDLGNHSLTLLRHAKVSAGNRPLILGETGYARLLVKGASTLDSVSAVIGDGWGSTAEMTVQGLGSKWTNRGNMNIGTHGKATLNILDSGSVISKSTSIGNGGKVTIDGLGSSWTNSDYLNVGYLGEGTLSVTNGGALNSGRSTIGDGTGHTSLVTIDGTGSKWTNQSLSIGVPGHGRLKITNGGAVISGESIIGAQGDGSLVVDSGGSVKSDKGTIGSTVGGVGVASINSQGSTWTIRDRLTVGNQGTGTLNVENGGKVESASTVIGNAIGGSGTVTVNGDGSQWRNQGDLFIGQGGQGLLNIENHGLVSVGGHFRILRTGVVNLSGGTFEVVNQDEVRPGPGGQFNWRAGTLSITGADGVTLGRNEIFSPVTTLTSGKTLAVSRSLNVNSGNLLWLNGGSVKAGTLALNGGQIVFDNGSHLDMNDIGTLSGYGKLASTVSGGTAANTIRANNGNLLLGDANSTQGFEFGGKLEVGSNQVTLLDKDKAHLGVSTILASGGKLITVNGADLGSGETLSYTGNASILGNFTNNGDVSGTDGVLTFLNDVNGAGGFNGSVAFHGDYNPGNSPAAIDFHGGDISFNATSVVTMEIFGKQAGSQYDQLLNIDHFDFNGTLALVFGGNFTPVAGDVFKLFDFAGFIGSFSPDRISVAGIDRKLLDFSNLAANGSLRVAAVPLPTAVWLFLSGLLGILAKSRRNIRHSARQS